MAAAAKLGLAITAARFGCAASAANAFELDATVAMAEAFLWTAKHPVEARAQAMRGRELVQREWSREKAFGDLRRVIDDCIGRPALAEAS